MHILEKAIIAIIKINRQDILNNFLDSSKFNSLIYTNTRLSEL